MQGLKINYHYLNTCDMQCKFCFGGVNRDQSRETIIHTFINLCRVSKSINLAGGEIFTDIPLLKTLIKHALKSRVNVSLVTNGFILSQNLEDDDVHYIVKHVKKIGISIDSFNKDTNLSIGRHHEEATVTLRDLKAIKNLCDEHRTKLKINTVITKDNINEPIEDKIEALKPDVWKVLEVVSEDTDVKPTKTEFRQFQKRMDKKDLPIKIERNRSIRNSYVMFNNEGNVYLGGRVYPEFNINRLMKEGRADVNDRLFEFIKSKGFDEAAYWDRYTTNPEAITIHRNRYNKALGKHFRNPGGTVWFLDVEAISPRPHQRKKHRALGDTPIGLLYTALEVNGNFEITNRYSDYLKTGVHLGDVLEKKSENAYKDFLSLFIKRLLSSRPRTIIVSNVATEQSFLMDALYYGEPLDRSDYETVKKYIQTLTDIQKIAEKEIVSLPTKKQSSRNIHAILNQYRSDIFTYTRNGEKETFSSALVSKNLLDVYVEKKHMPQTLLEKIMNTILEYCLTDVYDDYELAYSYEVLKGLETENR